MTYEPETYEFEKRNRIHGRPLDKELPGGTFVEAPPRSHSMGSRTNPRDGQGTVWWAGGSGTVWAYESLMDDYDALVKENKRLTESLNMASDEWRRAAENAINMGRRYDVEHEKIATLESFLEGLPCPTPNEAFAGECPSCGSKTWECGTMLDVFRRLQEPKQ
jgi:hypothetical protein